MESGRTDQVPTAAPRRRKLSASLFGALDNARRIGRHAGWRFTLLWLLDRVLYRLGRTQILIVCIHDVDWLRSIPAPGVEPYEIRWATRQEVLAEADGSAEWLDPHMARAALDRGERCMGAFLDGRMVSCSWSASGGPLCQQLAIQVRPEMVYGHEAKTRPAHRGKGLYAAIVLTAARAAADAGREMVGYVYAGNSQAVCGSARMGKMRSGLIICQEGGERPWFWLSSFCRREGISVRRTGATSSMELARKGSRPA